MIHYLDKQQSQHTIESIAQLESVSFLHDAWTVESIKAWLDCDSNQAMLLVENSMIIGYCLYNQVFDEAEIIRLAVEPTVQQRGLASKLLKQLFSNLRKKLVINVLLEVRVDNKAAIKLYEKHGFKNIHSRKGYYRNRDGTTMDALVMQKVL